MIYAGSEYLPALFLPRLLLLHDKCLQQLCVSTQAAFVRGALRGFAPLPGPRAIATSSPDMRGDHPRSQRLPFRLQLRLTSLRLIAGCRLCVHRGIHLTSEHAVPTKVAETSCLAPLHPTYVFLSSAEKV